VYLRIEARFLTRPHIAKVERNVELCVFFALLVVGSVVKRFISFLHQLRCALKVANHKCRCV
jgi:hypothetical protein